MKNAASQLQESPYSGLFGLIVVLLGLALGHTTLVLQRHFTGGVSVIDSIVALLITIIGFTLVWIGLRKPENQASLLGYLGGTLIWVGVFEWTWEYFSHWLHLEPIMDEGMIIISPGLLMIQATSLLVVTLLVFLGANKDTRCRMFMWFHRNLKLRPGRMTPGYKRQYARIAAMEIIFVTWFIYICAIVINDPRLIGYDSVAAMVITGGFVVWGIYLANKLIKIRGLGAALRYAIPTANILWLPTEAFARWGLYPEIWVKPLDYSVIMSLFFVVFMAAAVVMYRAESLGSPEALTA